MKTTKKKDIIEKAEKLKELQEFEASIKDKMAELSKLKKYFKDNFDDDLKAGDVLVTRSETETRTLDTKALKAELSEEIIEAFTVLGLRVSIRAK
jgi:hypothetical protein